jgi:soluble lytic murein transglycosylase
MPADQWIDSLPFTETRRYVKAVLEHNIIFSKLLEQQPQRLTNLMQPIAP